MQQYVMYYTFFDIALHAIETKENSCRLVGIRLYELTDENILLNLRGVLCLDIK